MELPRQRPTPIKPQLQFSLARIFAATAFSAGAVFTCIQAVRLAESDPAAAKMLIMFSCTCAGGAIGTLLRNSFVGAAIGACVGIGVFSFWLVPPRH